MNTLSRSMPTPRRNLRPTPAVLTFAILVVSLVVAPDVSAGGRQERYPDLENGIYAELQTGKGNILIDLKYEQVPLTVTNFIGLAEGSIEHSEGDGPFYDGLTFHRVEEDFVIQGGDPAGDGTGGPGYRIPTEIDQNLRHNGAGVVAMANSGPNRNGSQFYITLQATPWLDGNYSIFGEVVHGQDVVGEIEQGDVIETVRIIRRGEEARDFPVNQERFDTLLAARQSEIEDQQAAAIQSQQAYVERNWPDAEQMDNGIRYIVEQEGSGEKPGDGDTVRVRYTGSLLNGMPFESTESQNEPAEFRLGEVRTIPGWEATIRDMRPGEERTAIIPPDLAFGDRGRQGIIPPNSFLVFEVELVAVNPE